MPQPRKCQNVYTTALTYKGWRRLEPTRRATLFTPELPNTETTRGDAMPAHVWGRRLWDFLLRKSGSVIPTSSQQLSPFRSLIPPATHTITCWSWATKPGTCGVMTVRVKGLLVSSAQQSLGLGTDRQACCSSFCHWKEHYFQSPNTKTLADMEGARTDLKLRSSVGRRCCSNPSLT